jgi:hypothetical protein
VFQKHLCNIVFLGWLLALLLVFFPQFPVFAAEGVNDPNACEFQPPATDRSSSVQNIRLIGLGGYNITWDNSYLGLHRWNTSQWPGVDYLVATTLPFKNGGTVRMAGWDGAGGGNSLFIDGEGACVGWYVFIGHLNYNPATRYSVGQHIGPDEAIGEPGCSGFEANCEENGSKIARHNHYSLGYQANIFSFTDETKPAFAGGHYWIHPSRVEVIGQAVQAPPPMEEQMSAPDYIDTEAMTPDQMDVTNGPIIDTVLIWVQNIRAPITIPLWAYISVSVSILILFFGKIRPIGFGGIIATMILVFGFYYATPVSAAPPPQLVFVDNKPIDIPTTPITDISPNSGTTPVENLVNTPTNINTPCEVSPKFSPAVLQFCGLITYYAKLNGLDPDFVAAVITQESGGNPEILSDAGAVGLIQVMPRDGISATFMCTNGPCFANRPSIAELKDPEFNLAYGTKMLANMGAGTDMRKALVSYGGNYNTKKYDFNKYYYADKVMAIYNANKN